MNSKKERKIRALLLDVGGVIMKINYELAHHLLKMFDQKKLKANNNWSTNILKTVQQLPPLQLYERGEITSSEFAKKISKIMGVENDEEFFFQNWNACLDGVIPGVEQLMAQLTDIIPIYVLTNTNKAHYDHFMKESVFHQYVKKIFASHRMGARKPEARFYQMALEQMDVLPGEVLFIDDLKENIEAARNLGINAELCHESPELIKEILIKYQVLKA